MALYKGGVSSAAPLRIQLSTSSTVCAFVKQVSAFGETSSGSASRPVLFSASSAGIGSGIAQPLDGAGEVAATSVITSFSTPPSDPSVSTFSSKLPMSLFIIYPRRSEVVVLPSGHLNLYASATGGHSWTE